MQTAPSSVVFESQHVAGVGAPGGPPAGLERWGSGPPGRLQPPSPRKPAASASVSAPRRSQRYDQQQLVGIYRELQARRGLALPPAISQDHPGLLAELGECDVLGTVQSILSAGMWHVIW